VIAKELQEPATTIHYNVKQLEQEGAIRAYKAVFDYKKIDEGLCTYIFVNLNQENYGNPEKIAKEIAEDTRVESVDIITGDYEMLIKLRTKDMDEYYAWIKEKVKKFGFAKTTSLSSLKQIKSEFVKME
jgi:DNA-binding Lrp family transcriptional regulator